jgi:predicted glycoside hydrolase/deacetylase ChbG (UPF0249 family)
MTSRQRALLALLCSMLASRGAEALQPRTLAAALGYPDSARLVILHADDAGMTPGINEATWRALRAGTVNSASVLTVAPFVERFSRARGRDEQADLGVHLTVTSESDRMRWAPAAGASTVPSLVDDTGHLPYRLSPTADTLQLEVELLAQVARARALGLAPTHVDSHQGALYFSGAPVFRTWRRAAKRSCLPMPIPRAFFGEMPYLVEALADGHVAINDVRIINPNVPPPEWPAFYDRVVRELAVGVTVIIVHLGLDTAAERQLFASHAAWGADWRARDAGVVASTAFREALRARGVALVTWGQVAAAQPICAAGPA